MRHIAISGERDMGVQSQNSGRQHFLRSGPLLVKILTLPSWFVKKSCMFFNVKPLPPVGAVNTDTDGKTRVPHNVSDHRTRAPKANEGSVGRFVRRLIASLFFRQNDFPQIHDPCVGL